MNVSFFLITSELFLQLKMFKLYTSDIGNVIVWCHITFDTLTLLQINFSNHKHQLTNTVLIQYNTFVTLSTNCNI